MKTEILTCERIEKGERPWTLSAARILPDRRPRFCVQILYDFSDRKERWFSLMQFIAACGGVALIHDLRGRGASAPTEEPKNPEDAVPSLGYDCETLFDDIDEIYARFGDPFGEPIPDPAENRLLPRFLFGHGLGALMAARYASRRSIAVDGLILSGLPHREASASVRLFGLGFLGLFAGDSYVPNGVNRRYLTRFDGEFVPEETSDGRFLWMTNDPAVREAFAADPLCCRPYPLADFKDLLRLTRDVWRPSTWDRVHDVPVLLMAGQNDPVSGGDDGMIRAGKFLSDMGFSQVDEKMYRGMRHDIFMDEGREAPFADLCRFALTHLPGKTAVQKQDPAGGENGEAE